MAFPTYDEFKQFLEANRDREFDQSTYYTCAMSACAGGPVSEGYSSDVDLDPPSWFERFEKLTTWGRGGTWTGGELLEVLLTISPGFGGGTRKKKKRSVESWSAPTPGPGHTRPSPG